SVKVAHHPLRSRREPHQGRGSRAGLPSNRESRHLTFIGMMRTRTMLPPRRRVRFMLGTHASRPFPMTIRPPVPRTSRFLAARMVLPLLAAALIALPGAAGAQEGRSCSFQDMRACRTCAELSDALEGIQPYDGAYEDDIKWTPL